MASSSDSKGRAARTRGSSSSKKPARKPAARKAPPRKAPARKPAAKKGGGRSGKTAAQRKAAGSRAPVAVGKSRRRAGRRSLRRLFLILLAVAAAALALDVALLWESVTDRMEGRAHEQPARITGAVPTLAPGGVATAEGWSSTWSELGYTQQAGKKLTGPGQFHIAGAAWRVWPLDGPALSLQVSNRRVQSLKRTDDGGRVPSWDFPLPAVSLLTGEDRARRSVVALSDMPLHLRRAVVAIEDERFFRHIGLDPRGLARAVWSNVTAGGISQGGSTLTQQLAKNMFLSAERSFTRKGQEALIALILEQRYSKDRILEAYLNEIYLGQRDGFAIHGVAEASRLWFGKELAALTPDESALLAGAIHSPNRTVPWKHPEEARRRRDLVLQKMRTLRALPEADVEAALERPVQTATARRGARRAPWFVDEAVQELGERYTHEALHRDGMELVSTLDPRMQDAAEAAVAATLAELRARHASLWSDGHGPEVALLAMDPQSGSIRALVGGSSYGHSQFNRAFEARRQPGSAFKPIVLAAGVADRWPRFGPASPVRDTPIDVPGAGPGGGTWSPRNHDGEFLGTIPLAEAVEKSRNPPFVRLGLELGASRVRRAAETLGVTSPLADVPSLAIGAQEVTPLDLAVAYSTLAAGGVRPAPRLLEGVRGREGHWLERGLPERTPAIDPRVATVVTDLLRGVVERGTGQGIRRSGFTLPVAAKTGTSNGSRDAWVVGYTPDLVCVVWVGFDEGRSLGLSSTQAALPLWARFMVTVEPLLSGDEFIPAPGSAEAGSYTPTLESPARAGLGAKAKLRPADRKKQRRGLREEDRQRRRDEAEAMRSMEAGSR